MAGLRVPWTKKLAQDEKLSAVDRQRVKRRYGYSALIIAIALAALIICGISLRPSGYWPEVIAAIMGVLLAIAELVARYRDDPAAAVFSTPAAVYVLVNAGASAGALYLLHVFNWTFGLTGTPLVVTQVLTAGFGSAALFRSSLLNVATGDQVIGIGPSAILNVILTAADRAVDRQRALIRATSTGVIMKGLSFDKGAESLLAYCVASMQNITATEVKAVENRISELRDQKNKAMPNAVKSQILGLQLLTLVGHRVLAEACTHVKNALLTQEDQVLETLRHGGDGTMLLRQLREEVGLELSETHSILSDLERRNIITVEGNPGEEVVKLTSPLLHLRSIDLLQAHHGGNISTLDLIRLVHIEPVRKALLRSVPGRFCILSTRLLPEDPAVRDDAAAMYRPQSTEASS